MENKFYYPAIFEQEGDGGYSIFFPDIPGCNSQGDDMKHAYDMAVDALGLMITYYEEEHMVLPEPSFPSNINLEENQFVVLINFDMLEYKKRVSTRAIKKTLSIPEWLNEAALEANINFSNVLQEALKQKLGIR